MNPHPRPVFFITYPQRLYPLAQAYSLILAQTEAEARDIAFREVGTCWAFMYTGQDELERQTQAFGLRPVCLAIASQILITQGEIKMPTNENPLDQQAGGTHYKRLAYQPIEFSMANALDQCAATALKYLARLGPDGKGQDAEDLPKVLHYIQLREHFRSAALPSAQPRHEGLRIPMTQFAEQPGIDPEARRLLYLLEDSLVDGGRATVNLINALEQATAQEIPATEPTTTKPASKEPTSAKAKSSKPGPKPKA